MDTPEEENRARIFAEKVLKYKGSSKMKIYLAGGMSFYNDWRDFIYKEFKDRSIFLDPRNSGSNNEKIYTEYDVNCVKQCDILFAFMDSSNPSGYGMSVELGLAYGLGKFIIFVDQTNFSKKKYFGMHRQMSNEVFKDLQDGVEFLKSLLLKEQ